MRHMPLRCSHNAVSGVTTGPVDYRHAFLDMRNLEVMESPYTRGGKTCPAAMGFSFAAGTTDGAAFPRSSCKPPAWPPEMRAHVIVS